MQDHKPKRSRCASAPVVTFPVHLTGSAPQAISDQATIRRDALSRVGDLERCLNALHERSMGSHVRSALGTLRKRIAAMEQRHQDS